jgi:protease-4
MLDLFNKQEFDIEEEFKTPERSYEVKGNVAIIPVGGLIARRVPDILKEYMQICDLNDLRTMLKQADKNPEIDTIVLDIDSGGGYTIGGDETCRLIKDIATRKVVVSYSETFMASMAYRIGAAADIIITTPTAMVGSTGGYIVIEEYTEAYKNMGINVIPISVGKFKLAHGEVTKKTEADIAYITEAVVKETQMFWDFINSQRPQIGMDELQLAKVYSGADALTKGFVDTFVDDKDELISQFVH